MKSASIIMGLVFTVSAGHALAQRYDVFLLAGQSNMTGRGYVETAPEPYDPNSTVDSRIKMWSPLATTKIVPAADPIVHAEPIRKKGSDNLTRGVGPGLSFARAYLNFVARTEGDTSRQVLLVGAAWGGTGLFSSASGTNCNWNDSEVPITPPTPPRKQCMLQGGSIPITLRGNAVAQVNAALAVPGTSFKGILWHQGENDLINHGSSYASRHRPLIQYFRSNIKDPSGAAVAAAVPLVVGEMNPVVLNRNLLNADGTPDTEGIANRQALMDYFHQIQSDPAVAPAAWVSSVGLTSNNMTDDTVHIDAASQREMGKRYFSKWYEALQGIPAPKAHLKSFNGKFFNVGTDIDFDLSYNVYGTTTSGRQTGNVALSGTVTVDLGSVLGDAARIVGAAGALKIKTPGKYFNGSYTKAAWVQASSLAYENNLISINSSVQSHQLSSTVTTGTFQAGHGTLKGTNIDAKVTTTSGTGTNSFKHVAVVYADDPVANLGTLSLYVDGVLVNQQASVPRAYRSSQVLYARFGSFNGIAGDVSGLDGWMISNRIYDQALTAQQISRIYTLERDLEKGYGR